MIKKFLKLFGIFLIFILLAKNVFSDWYAITITNNQSIPTPVPFQQQIAICNGTINAGPNFAYINNATLFNLINSNGSNVYFTTNYNGTPNIYSWYEGQLNYNGVTCDVWWINLSNGIPANSNITIYMHIGPNSDNYYQQYYPYVGASPNIFPSRQYDNGKYVFIAYGYFNNTTDGWIGYKSPFSSVNYVPQATLNGIQMLDAKDYEGTYILPPNNWNIPKIPLIVEEAWYFCGTADSNVIALFGDTNQQIYAYSVGNGGPSSYTPAPSSSTFVQFNYYSNTGLYTHLKSAITNSILSKTSFVSGCHTIYSYLIINSTYAQTGYYDYSSNQVWAPLTLLNTYTVNKNGYIYANLNYNPFQYGTLEIGAGALAISFGSSIQYIQWVIARAYSPNGVMPSFSIQQLLLTSTISVNTSTNFQFNVSISDPYSEYVNYTIYLNGSVLTTNNVSVTAYQTLTIPYEFPYLFNQSGTYNLTVVAYGQSSKVTAIATNIFTIDIPPPTAYINVNTQSNLLFNVTISDGLPENVNYIIYLNGTQLTNGNVQITLPSITIQAVNVTLPFNYTYLLNQSGYYNLTVVVYGNKSSITNSTTNIFTIQLDQILNVSMSPIPYVYNNVNYTDLYNSNLNITYYCMRPNNTLIIYDNVTNQTLQYNLSCNYIQTINNLFVNLTSILQNNTLNYINGSLLYGNQSFGSISFIPLWDTVVVNLTIYLPQILVYTAPLGLNYTLIVRDVLPNVTCNTSFYDNNTLIANNQSILTNESITYSWVISKAPIHNFSWSILCKDPVNVTTDFIYSIGPFYYNQFNLYMEDTGNIPSNVKYSLTLECINNTVQYSNTDMNAYTLYLWTNDKCNFIIISQNIQGYTFDEAFSTNLLSNYGFQWSICLINTSLIYYYNPLVGSKPYQSTLISIENPQTGCYLLGSYLYLYSSNNYYAPIPVRLGALYSIRINNTFLATVLGSQQQAISIDQLIVQLQQQALSFINVTLTGAYVNLTYTNGYPTLVIQTPYTIDSVYIQLYNNSQLIQTYNLTSVNSNVTNIIITKPLGFNFTNEQYAVITINYVNGLSQVLYYPPYKGYGTIPYIISWIIMLALLYEWFSAYQHYWKIIISIFIMVGALIIATFFDVAAIPLLLLSGFLAIYLYDFAIKFFIEKTMGEQPLFKFASIFFKIILVMMFVSTILASFNVPGMGQVFTNIQAEIDTAQNIQNAINTISANPISFPIEIVLLAGYLIYGMITSVTIIGGLISMILGFLAPALGPFVNILSISISGILYIAIAVVIITSLWVILFGIGYFRL